MRPRLLLGLALAPLAALAGCDHGEPFAGQYQTDEPRTPGLPRRLTYAHAGELAPAWTPDGSAIVYTRTRTDGDRCVAFLPAEGGQVHRQLCLGRAYTERTVDAQQEGALGPDGTLAFVRSSSPQPDAVGVAAELVVTDSLGRRPRVVHTMPTRAANGMWYHDASRLRWLDSTRLVFVAEQLRCTNRCIDTVRTGIGVLQVTLAAGGDDGGGDGGGGTSSVELLPGTDGASSVAMGEAGELYLTRMHDGRVYRRSPDGTVSVAWDFGPGTIARDVAWHGGRLLAVVDGIIGSVDDPFDEPDAGAGYVDDGGVLHAVDLAAGAVRRLDLPGRRVVRRPALSPDGSRLVVEVLLDGIGPDLWLYETPWPGAEP